MQLLFCGEQTGMKNLWDLRYLGAIEEGFEIITFNHSHVQTEKSMRGASAFQAGMWHLVEQLYFLCFWGFIAKDIRDCKKYL